MLGASAVQMLIGVGRPGLSRGLIEDVRDTTAIARARASARTLAALPELKNDRHRVVRFTGEQREQLDKRLSATDERLPQQVVMAYRHLVLLGEGNGGGIKLDHIDLGPTRVDVSIPSRALDCLTAHQ